MRTCCPKGFFDNAHREQRTRQWHRLLAEQNPAHRLAVAEADGQLRGFALAAPPVDGARPADLPGL